MALSMFRSLDDIVIVKSPPPADVRILSADEDQKTPIKNDRDLNKKIKELEEARILSENLMKSRITF